jgi:two-component system, chemotaxis family, sensor kinase CheA
MDRDALVRRLMKTFLDELEEHVRALDGDLLALERGPDPSVRIDIFKTLFRTAHSLKGASRSVDIVIIEAAAHRLESIFADARDGTINLGPKLFELLFAAVDALKDVAGRLAAGEDIGESRLAALLPRLEAASAAQASTPNPIIAPAAPEDGAAGSETSPTLTEAVEAPVAPTRDGSVRISSVKLDHILALGGELLVASRRAELRGADVARLQDMAKRWEAEWRAAEGAMRHALRANADGAAASPMPARTAHSPMRLLERTKENLQRLTRELDNLASGLATDNRALERVVGPLEAEVKRARMMPFSEACQGFERVVRDLAEGAGKEVDLTVKGGDIEIDRSVVEGVKDPLLHLVRNAVDHGIELPALRVAAGKAARGRITMTAALRNGRVEIAVADDGRGFNVGAIREQARKRNLPLPEDDREVARLVFTPGFSTSPIITEISGRGIGLDVAKSAIEARRGSVDFAFEAGLGTRIVLTVPLSLSRIPALLVTAGGQTYAFDSAAVRGLQRVGADDLRAMEGRDVLALEGGPVPVFCLTDILGRPTHEAARMGSSAPVVVLGAGTSLAAFTVDELLSEQEVVVKDLGSRLRRVRNVIGATIVSTGRIALILNAAELVRTALGYAPSQALSAALAEQPRDAMKRLIVVDDSLTTRTLMKSILEAAGYEVIAAADGMDAWQILQEKGADLVVSDVEMPRMDGFALAEAIRGSKRLRHLPVILVTALETEADKIRGLEAGADAYLPKGSFDQTTLIQTIGQLL